MNAKEQIAAAIAAKEALILEVSDKVWGYAELGFRESQSASLYCQTLRSEGFTVRTGLAGIETAFVGSFGSGKPVIGFLAEFDALPSLSQEAGCAVKTPTQVDGNGHGCGHNALGAGSLAAALAVKEYLTQNQLPGTVEFYGCPAEESGCGKTFMARDGIFKDLDVAFSWHPSDRNAAQSVGSLANVIVYFKFKGKTAHAAAAPHLGRSALDACEIMNVGVNYLREHIVPEARLHYAYRDVGGPAPNVVQDHASVLYYIRAPKAAQVLEIYERVKDVARGAALITGTQMEFEQVAGLSDYIPNRTLTKVLADAFQETGAPDFDAEDFAMAAKFFSTYPEAQQEAIKAQIRRQYGEMGETVIAKPLDTKVEPYVPSTAVMPASTDVGDVSYCVPTAQLTAATGAIGTAPHTWQMTAQGGASIGHKGLLAAGRAMALAAVRVLEDPSIAQKAKEELKATTGGVYLCPIPPEVSPALEL